MTFFSSTAFSSSRLFSRAFARSFTAPTSLSLAPEGTASSGNMSEHRSQKATVAAGCFWGVEHLYRKYFGYPRGLLDAKVGYAGGNTANPTYRAVCSGTTGHAEALQITFDPGVVTYRELLEFFYRMHDPTTANRQGPDVGTQYRSVIFTHDDGQEEVAKNITEKVGKQWYTGKPITTQIVPMGDWWNAEDYHQLYLENNPSGYECPSHFVRNFPPLAD